MIQYEHNEDRDLIKNVELERDKYLNVRVAPLINNIEDSGIQIKNFHISYYSVSE